eukprot:4270713-Pyramimonas_sp.AAC.1
MEYLSAAPSSSSPGRGGGLTTAEVRGGWAWRRWGGKFMAGKASSFSAVRRCERHGGEPRMGEREGRL